MSDRRVHDSLLALAALDKPFMQKYGDLVRPSIFEGTSHDVTSFDRQYVAEVALEYWKAKRECVGPLLPSLVRRTYADQLPSVRYKTVLRYAKDIAGRRVVNGKILGVPRNGVADFLVRINEERNVERFVGWISKHNGKVSAADIRAKVSEMLPSMAHQRPRILTPLEADLNSFRVQVGLMLTENTFYPDIGIPGLNIDLAGPKDMGLVLAPYKRGKSLFMQHLAMTFVAQGLTVLQLDLENKEELNRKRYMAAALGIPIRELHQHSGDALVKQFRNQMWRWDKGRLRLMSLASSATTIEDVEMYVEQAMESEFPPHVVLVDYDDKIKPSNSRHNGDNFRFGSMEVYERSKYLCERFNLIWWMAAQAKRDAVGKTRVEGSDVAENINKIKDVAVVLTLGLGPEKNTITLTVSENRNDIGGVSVVVPTDFARMRFVDYDAALAANRKEVPKGKR